MKSCSKCKTAKPLIDFNKSKACFDGLYPTCKDCRSLLSLKYREKHGDKIRDKWRQAYKLNPHKHRENSRKYQRDNWEYRKAYKRLWDKNNPEKCRARCAKRSSSIKKATPKWLSKDHKAQINWFYNTRKELQWLSESKLSVDHIEPLNGEISCGLHVPWNLQIIPVIENSKKGNKIGCEP